MFGTKLSEEGFCVDALYKLAASLSSQLDFDELFQTIVSIGCELVNTSHGFIYVVDREKEVLELKAGTGIYTYYQGVLRSKAEPSVSSSVWNSGQMLAVDNLSQWDGRAQDRPYGWDSVKSVLGLPVFAGHEVIAVLGMGFEEPKPELPAEKIEMLSRFAVLASLALNNARLYSELNTQLLAQKLINKEQQAIIGQQLKLYHEEIKLAQSTQELLQDSFRGGSVHSLLARRLRRMTQLQLAENYLQSGPWDEQRQNQTRQPRDSLTSREITVLRLIAAGLSNQEIANETKVTVNTVKTHVSHILTKMGVKSRVQALVKAREENLI